MLETYVANALGARLYFREGKKEIDIILRDGDTLPVEVRTSVGDRDLKKFSALLDYVGAERGIMIALDQASSRGKVEVRPAYETEKIQPQAK